MATTEQKRKRAVKRKKRRNEQRKLLREARAITGMTAEDLGRIDPVEAIQRVLDRSYAQLVVAATEVDNLESDEIWRSTMVGLVPNEWIRLEKELRNEVGNTANRMLQLDIDDRKAHAAEVIAAVMAPVLEGVFKDLKLTDAQKRKAKESVGAHLRLLEGGAERDAA